MKLINIVRKYLTDNGFDGLFCDCGIDCACKVDDLMPCDHPSTDCTAGYLQPLTDEDDEDYGFRIGLVKPKEANDDKA